MRCGALFAASCLLASAAFGQEEAAAAGQAGAGFGWLTLLPPLIAIAMALVFREVLPALILGVFSGAMILSGGNPFAAFGRTIDRYVLNALADAEHAAILIFSALLGAMVAVISRSGGTRGIVEWISPLATSPRKGQFATWLIGVGIFFDDYANTLIVGTTMRPITDRLRISREKLAFIVDTTAAPIVSLVPISTWIGFEIGLIQGAFSDLGLDRNAFATVVESIPYRFYQLLALFLGLTVALSSRDFGAMFRAEARARESGEVQAADHEPLADFSSELLNPPEGRPHRPVNALLPIASVIAVTLLGLYATGSAELERAPGMSTFEWLRNVLSNADSYTALLWASFSGLTVAIFAPALQTIITVKEGIQAAIEGCKATLVAFLVLLLAWSLGAVCSDLGTAQFLVQIAEGQLAAELMPTITFLLAAAVSFATGTAWGTMGILSPLALPLAHSLSLGSGMSATGPGYEAVLLGTVAAVLAGSVWGDHCSPISDTTILSSMASGCDHVAHVRTQIPYALVAASLAIAVGFLPSGYGFSPGLGLLLGCALILAVLRIFGRRLPEAPLES